MVLIRTQPNGDAASPVREIYDEILQTVPFVPKPVQLMSASPELMTGYWTMFRRVLGHPRLSRALLALVRLGVAMDSEFPYCTELNGAVLKSMLDLTDDQLAEIRQDPAKAALPEDEIALAMFVIGAVHKPETVTAEDVEHLRRLGWDDESIFVATFQGAFMLTMGVMFTAFGMAED
jgi:hypothetical protein